MHVWLTSDGIKVASYLDYALTCITRPARNNIILIQWDYYCYLKCSQTATLASTSTLLQGWRHLMSKWEMHTWTSDVFIRDLNLGIALEKRRKEDRKVNPLTSNAAFLQVCSKHGLNEKKWCWKGNISSIRTIRNMEWKGAALSWWTKRRPGLRSPRGWSCRAWSSDERAWISRQCRETSGTSISGEI